MDKELEVLEHISKDSNITQRKIAERTGLSLGAANILIKRLIKKGILKVEKINSRTLRYLLTPKGMVEKTKMTYAYIVYSYNYIDSLNKKIKEICSNMAEVDIIYLYGEKDEVCEIVINSLNEKAIKNKILNNNELDMISCNHPQIIIVWNLEKGQYLSDKGIKSINILQF
ncbi:MAG: winged helix-turn-helix transcriptional regulator [Clostridia bacterium]|nr:winged helix-turn-helix transcriptional regulator [Clostridia bacterium]